MSGGGWVIVLSVIVALILQAIVVPADLPQEFSYGRPDWVAMVLIYWIIALPHRVGILTAWSCGIMLDVLLGTLLGQHAMGLILVAYLTSNFYQRMRMISVWQQGIFVFVMMIAIQILYFWMTTLSHERAWSYLYLLPAVVSALLWPWIFLVLRFARRQFRVS